MSILVLKEQKIVPSKPKPGFSKPALIHFPQKPAFYRFYARFCVAKFRRTPLCTLQPPSALPSPYLLPADFFFPLYPLSLLLMRARHLTLTPTDSLPSAQLVVTGLTKLKMGDTFSDMLNVTLATR